MVTGMNFTTVEKVVRGVFEVMDLDGDGALSTKDIPQASRERLDTNNDGKVALKELLGHDIIFFPRPVQSVYRVLDSNKDEVVSMTEATNFINFLGRLFNILDANSNCMVTLDEALEALDTAQLPKVHVTPAKHFQTVICRISSSPWSCGFAPTPPWGATWRSPPSSWPAVLAASPSTSYSTSGATPSLMTPVLWPCQST